MSEWRGVVIQLALIASLTAIVMKASDPMILHSGVAIIGTAIGTAVMRSRSAGLDSGAPGKGGKPGASFLPIIGAIVGGCLAVLLFAFVQGCGAAPSAAQQDRVKAYELGLLSCVAVAAATDAGVDASRACREKTMRAYGRLEAGKP
jgi:hypothetical protein